MVATTTNNWCLGVDIGGTKISMIVVDDANTIHHRTQIATPDADGIVHAITDYLSQTHAPIAGIAVGTTGVVSPHTGSILSASDSIAGWHGFALKAQLHHQTGLPVVVENDVNAFVLAEYHAHPSPETSLLGIMLGTGVGGGAVIDGDLLRGDHGAAVEIGHMPGFGQHLCTCGGTGHLETIAGGRGLAQRYTEATHKPITAQRMARQADHGDRLAVKLFYEAGYQLGIATLITATLLDVTTVVLGGGVIKAWSHLRPGFNESLNRYPLISGHKLAVSLATTGADAVAWGAIHSWRHHHLTT